jgi:hypothetical protein
MKSQRGAGGGLRKDHRDDRRMKQHGMRRGDGMDVRDLVDPCVGEGNKGDVVVAWEHASSVYS